MTPMMNMYQDIRDNLHFNKFSVGELLFVEYKCPIEQDTAGVWTPMDYFVHVVSGTKTWRTTEGRWTLGKGQTLFLVLLKNPLKFFVCSFKSTLTSDDIAFIVFS